MKNSATKTFFAKVNKIAHPALKSVAHALKGENIRNRNATCIKNGVWALALEMLNYKSIEFTVKYSLDGEVIEFRGREGKHSAIIILSLDELKCGSGSDVVTALFRELDHLAKFNKQLRKEIITLLMGMVRQLIKLLHEEQMVSVDENRYVGETPDSVRAFAVFLRGFHEASEIAFIGHRELGAYVRGWFFRLLDAEHVDLTVKRDGLLRRVWLTMGDKEIEMLVGFDGTKNHVVYADLREFSEKSGQIESFNFPNLKVYGHLLCALNVLVSRIGYRITSVNDGNIVRTFSSGERAFESFTMEELINEDHDEIPDEELKVDVDDEVNVEGNDVQKPETEAEDVGIAVDTAVGLALTEALKELQEEKEKEVKVLTPVSDPDPFATAVSDAATPSNNDSSSD